MRTAPRTSHPRRTEETSRSCLVVSAAGLLLALSLDRSVAIAGPEPGDEGLVSRWVFDAEHVAGAELRAAVGSQHGTVLGPVRLQTDVAPRGLSLDGETNSVLLARSPDVSRLPAQDISVEAWVAVDEPREWGGIIGAVQDDGDFERGWLLGFRKDRFTFALASEKAARLTYLTAKRGFRPGEWYHVVGTYDGRTQRLYVNGELEAEDGSQQGAILYPPTFFYEVGAYHDDDEQYRMSGAVHEIAVHERALGISEVRRRHAEKAARFRDPGAGAESSRSSGTDVVAHFVFAPEHTAEKTVRSVSGSVTARLLHDASVIGGRGPPALALDGEGDAARVEGGDEPLRLPRSRLTVESWISLDRTDGRAGIISALGGDASRPRGWTLGHDAGRLVFGLTASGTRDRDGITYVRSTTELEPGRWYHVICTFDAFTQKLYVNGALEGKSRVEFGRILYPENVALDIGAQRLEGELLTLAGLVHQASVLERRLTPAEVRERYEAKRELFPRPFELAAGPFVANLSRSSVRIHWETHEAAPSILVHGLDGKLTERLVEPGLRRVHGLTVAGIEVGRTYSFAVKIPAEGSFAVKVPAAGRSSELWSRVFRWDSTFNYRLPDTPQRPSPYPEDELATMYRSVAERVVEETGIRQGYCLVLGGEEGRLAYELARRTDLKIVILENDPAKAARARRRLDEAGLYGLRVSVHRGTLAEKNYARYLANLIVSDTALLEGTPPESARDIHRVLRPCGGTIYLAYAGSKAPGEARRSLREWFARGGLEDVDVRDQGGLRLVYRRPKLTGASDWTHQYGSADNSASNGDQLVRGDLEVLWWGRPGPRPMPDRGARNPAPLSANGRLFIQGDRLLFGLDAYNGTILWTLAMPDVRRSNLPRDSSNFVATDDTLYLATGSRCEALDAGSGARRFLLDLPEKRTDGEYDWGYLGCVGETLLGSAVKRGGAYQGDDGEWFDGPKPEETAKVTSDYLAAFDRRSGESRWRYRQGAIINSTISAREKTVYFVESRSDAARSSDRSRLAQEIARDHFLVALDLESGRKLWERPHDFSRCQRVMYLSHGRDTLVVTGSSDRYHLWAFDARYGHLLWQLDHPFARDHHGGAIQHPVIVGDDLYSVKNAYHLRSGKVTRSDLPERRGCGTMSASGSLFFFRHHYHGVWDVESGTRREFPGIRAGCWLGIIPAGGIVLAPESSSGCFCTHAIQISVAYAPRRRTPEPAGR